MTALEPLAPSGCGCDRRDTAGKLIPIDTALSLIADRAQPVAETETLYLQDARGRILAAPVVAQAAIPPFDSAAMDGYALATSALSGPGPWTLPVVARGPAGQPAAALSGLQASRIFTGAPLPAGADAVIMQEEVRRHAHSIRIAQRPIPGQNIRHAASEMPRGAVMLPEGSRLGPREIAACASAGASHLLLRRRLRVSLLVTGDELRQTGAPRDAAQIWDVNTPMLRTLLAARPEVDLIAVETGLDSRDGLFLQIAELAGASDLLITTGGISVGEEDHVKPAILARGGKIAFSGVAIKPGKPVSYGQIGSTHWLGLPGNPLSAFVTWHLFGQALLHRLTGNHSAGPARRHVVTADPVRHKPGRCEYRPARCIGFDPQGREVVTFAAETHSARVGALHAADGLMLIPADAADLPPGALAEFLPFC